MSAKLRAVLWPHGGQTATGRSWVGCQHPRRLATSKRNALKREVATALLRGWRVRLAMNRSLHFGKMRVDGLVQSIRGWRRAAIDWCASLGGEEGHREIL